MKMKLLACLLMVCAVVLTMAGPILATEEGGTCGENVTWAFDAATGTLTFSGTGTINDGSENVVGDWYIHSAELEHIVFEDGITYIGAYLFYRNGDEALYPQVKTVTIPASVTGIGAYAFSGLSTLETVNIADVGQWCGIAFGSAANPLNNGAALCLSGTTVEQLVLPETVSEIGAYAFKGCTSIKSVEVPGSVKSVGSFSFNSCPNLETVYFRGDMPAFGEAVFTLSEVTAYFPADNETWIVEQLPDDDGAVTWATTACQGPHQEVPIPGQAATCTEDGLTDGSYCSVCEAVLVEQEIIPATGHSYGEWEEVKAPTVEETGLAQQTCSVCGDVQEKILDKLTPGTEPTEPAPTEPKPTEPAPTEPKPTEPAPTEPKPTEPAPTEPKPTEPKPTEPKPTEPKPTETKPTDPPETEPTQSVVTEPSQTAPDETEPRESQSQTTAPAATQPVNTVPRATEPADEKQSGISVIRWILPVAAAVMLIAGGAVGIVFNRKRRF